MWSLGANFRLGLIVFIVNIISLMSGMMLTWPSPVLPKLISVEHLYQNPLGRIITLTEESWIAGLMSIGGIFGPSITGFIMEKFGRKLAIACVHLPNIFSCLLAAFGNNVWYFYVARVAAGMSINSGIAMGAIYFGEVGEKRTRGSLFSTTSIFINLGTLLTYCIGPYTTIRNFNLILLSIVVIGILATWLYVPESPYFLVQKGKYEEAEESLKILRGTSQVKDEIEEIKSDISKMTHDGVFAIFETKASRKSFALAFFLINMMQFSGVNVIYTYTQMIFNEAGTNLGADISSILVGVAQFLSIFITTFGVDNFGRKKMMGFASGCMALTLATLATFFQLQARGNDTSQISWLPLTCLILFFVFFNCGLGALPFLYMGEILPLNIKSASTSIIMGSFCLVGFLITYFFNSITQKIGTGGGFYIFASAMVLNALYVMIFLFETKGKTLQEINDHLNNKSKETSSIKGPGL
ncbi:facilitated trehalose transporter Tret1-like [Anthonomus grandis grandis]|uniref:facilitated trehalose transporter Tret1-like n=1 Tax=Anthonomus grandis grandis TaxID=2921223 RepID=UPI002165AC11|nr:facilitated trehalose transporter Tret1-like [Anthonomus grandis grandis]